MPLPWEGAGQAHSSLGSAHLCPPQTSSSQRPQPCVQPGCEHRDTAAEPECMTTGGDCWGQPGQPHALRPPTSPFPLCSHCPVSPWMPPTTGCSAPQGKAAVSTLWLFPPGVGSRLEQGTGADRASGGAHCPARGPRHFFASTTPVHMSRCLFTDRRWTHR